MNHLAKILLLSFVVFFSCSKKKSHSSIFLLGSLSKQEILSNQSLQCEQENCPSGVVRILQFKGNEVYTCSGFLLAEDVVGTNGHCISKISHLEKNKCSDIYVVGQIKNAGVHQYSQCSHVIDSFRSDNSDRDYAFLKLKNKLSGKKFEVSTEGIKDKEKLTAWTLLQDGSLKATIEKKSCSALMKHILYYSYNHKDFPTILYHCDREIISGNSGSVLVDELNFAKGIVSHTIGLGPYPKNLKEHPLGLGMNFACLENSYVQGSLNSSCLNSREDLKNHELKMKIKYDESKNYSIKQSLDKKLHAFFEFDKFLNHKRIESMLKLENDNFQGLLVPSCYKKLEGIELLNEESFTFTYIDLGFKMSEVSPLGQFESLIDLKLKKTFKLKLSTKMKASSDEIDIRLTYYKHSKTYKIKKCTIGI